MFLEGEFDVCAVPRANMYDLLTSTYNPIEGVNLVYNVANLANEVDAVRHEYFTRKPIPILCGLPNTHDRTRSVLLQQHTHKKGLRMGTQLYIVFP